LKTIKTLTILTLIFNALILIGAGHGIAPFIYGEFAALNWISEDLNSIKFYGNYDDLLTLTLIISLICQFILLYSFFEKKILKKLQLKIYATTVLILSILYLTKDFISSNLDRFTLICSIPFLISGIILIEKSFKTLKFENQKKHYS